MFVIGFFEFFFDYILENLFSLVIDNCEMSFEEYYEYHRIKFVRKKRKYSKKFVFNFYRNPRYFFWFKFTMNKYSRSYPYWYWHLVHRHFRGLHFYRHQVFRFYKYNYVLYGGYSYEQSKYSFSWFKYMNFFLLSEISELFFDLHFPLQNNVNFTNFNLKYKGGDFFFYKKTSGVITDKIYFNKIYSTFWFNNKHPLFSMLKRNVFENYLYIYNVDNMFLNSKYCYFKQYNTNTLGVDFCKSIGDIKNTQTFYFFKNKKFEVNWFLKLNEFDFLKKIYISGIHDFEKFNFFLKSFYSNFKYSNNDTLYNDFDNFIFKKNQIIDNNYINSICYFSYLNENKDCLFLKNNTLFTVKKNFLNPIFLNFFNTHFNDELPDFFFNFKRVMGEYGYGGLSNVDSVILNTFLFKLNLRLNLKEQLFLKEFEYLKNIKYISNIYNLPDIYLNAGNNFFFDLLLEYSLIYNTDVMGRVNDNINKYNYFNLYYNEGLGSKLKHSFNNSNFNYRFIKSGFIKNTNTLYWWEWDIYNFFTNFLNNLD